MDSWKQLVAQKEIVIAENALYNSNTSQERDDSASRSNFNGQTLRLLEFIISLSYIIYNVALKTYEYFGAFQIISTVLCLLLLVLHFDYFEKKLSPETVFSIEFWFNILSFFFWLIISVGLGAVNLPKTVIHQVNMFLSILLTILFFSSLGTSYGDLEAYRKRRNKIDQRKKRMFGFLRFWKRNTQVQSQELV